MDRISTKDMTKSEWLDQRHNGIGGSDVSSVLGLNPYKASAELFYEKVLRINQTEENQPMHWGKALEDIIANRWQYWDGDPDGMIRNYSDRKVIRKCQRLNAIIRNNDYPWLSANLDRVILSQSAGKGVLEIKTVSGWAADQWRDGIPPYYLIQLQTYLLVTGYQYGEIAILRDGRYMEVIPFNREDAIIDKIVEKTEVFWKNIVTARELLGPYVSGKEIYNFDDFSNISISDDVKRELSELEPAPDDSVAYENYLKTRYKIQPITKRGTPEQLAKAIEYLSFSKIIKGYEARKRGISNELKNEMAEAELLDFNGNGKITHKEDTNGVKRFIVKVKGAENETA